MLCAILPISRSGGHEHDVSLGQCLVLVDAVDTDGLEALAPLCRDLDMVDLEVRARRLVARRTPIFPPAPSKATFVISCSPFLFGFS